jgi:hypothetical protein
MMGCTHVLGHRPLLVAPRGGHNKSVFEYKVVSSCGHSNAMLAILSFTFLKF